MKTIEIKQVVLSKNEKFIVDNYDYQTPAEIMSAINTNLWDYRGLCSRLSKLGLILTPNAKKKLALQEQEAKANTYANEGGELKAVARSMVVDEIALTEKVGKVLSLPFETCKFEQQLVDSISDEFSFVGVERVKETYFNMLDTVSDLRLNMSCIQGDFIDTVRNSRKNEYAHVYADFCGYFEDFYKDIKLMFKKNIVQVGGTIAITLTNRSFKKTNDVLTRMNNLNPIGLMGGNEVENGVKTFLIKEGGNKYALTRTFSYKDEDRQAMILFILKRVE